MSTVLEIDDLTVAFGSGPRGVKAVEEVTLTIEAGDICALVGESGCGKSTLAYSLLNIVPPPGRITGGDVRLRGKSLQRMPSKALRKILGAEIAIVFQAAMNAFNPVITIGTQVEHTLAAHPDVFKSRAEGRAHFEHLLELVRLRPEQIWDAFESQLSGGMKQRVAIALALLLKPGVIILDEPTTALDVLNQRLVVDILKDLHRELGITIIFVTHDLAVVAELASRVAVMYAGRLVEAGTVRDIFKSQRRHPYVRALVEAIPSVLDRGLRVQPIGGQVPNLAELPPGCRFAPRCPRAEERCHRAEPALIADQDGHEVACFVVNDQLEGVAS